MSSTNTWRSSSRASILTKAARRPPLCRATSQPPRRVLVRGGIGEAVQDSAVAIVRPGLILRMVRLEGGTRARFALFLEPFQPRDLLRAAAQRYGFTAREREVLNLVLRGESTSSISQRLHIADATVQHHVKNIGSKVGVSKRVEIVAAIVGSIG